MIAFEVSDDYAREYAKLYSDIDAGAKSVSLEFRAKRHDRICRVSLSPMEFDTDGSVLIALGVVQDGRDSLNQFYTESEALYEEQKRQDALETQFEKRTDRYGQRYSGHRPWYGNQKNIVDMMGGKITARSELGKGTEFGVLLERAGPSLS